MLKKLYLLALIPLTISFVSCEKKESQEKLGPSPGDGIIHNEEAGEAFGPSPGDG